MIDIALLVVSHLRNAGSNVYWGILPESVKRPVGRLEMTGTILQSSHGPGWLGEYDAQLDVWGGNRQEAHNFLSQVVAELRSQPSNEHGTVTRFQVVSVIEEPDPDWLVHGQPGPRFIAQLRFHAHPAA